MTNIMLYPQLHNPFPIPPESLDSTSFASLPPQVALNVALVLTGARNAFQIDDEDTPDYDMGAQNLLAEIQAVVRRVAPQCAPLETFRNTLYSSRSAPRRAFWTVLWCRHNAEAASTGQALKRLERQLGADRGASVAEARTRSGDLVFGMRKMYREMQEMVGRILGLRCPPDAYLRQAGHEKSLYRIMFVCGTEFPLEHKFRAEMCRGAIPPDSILRDAQSYAAIANRMGLFVSVILQPTQRITTGVFVEDRYAFLANYQDNRKRPKS
jgi:hypothetical protein